ncbi:MAG: hypothetical protein ACK5D9_06485 [Burkholderiales bacterium]|jgi:hypothetical protein
MKTYTLLIGLAICGLTPGANAETIPEPPVPKLFTDILDRTCDVEHVRVLKSATRREFLGMFNLSIEPSKSRSADHTVYYDSTDTQLSKKLKPGARLCGFEIPKPRTLPDTPTSIPAPDLVTDSMGVKCDKKMLFPLYDITKDPNDKDPRMYFIFFKYEPESIVVNRQRAVIAPDALKSLRRGMPVCEREID